MDGRGISASSRRCLPRPTPGDRDRRLPPPTKVGRTAVPDSSLSLPRVFLDARVGTLLGSQGFLPRSRRGARDLDGLVQEGKDAQAADRRAPGPIPEGLWVKCAGCKEIIYNKEVATNPNVCPKCDYHFRISARERLDAALRRRVLRRVRHGHRPDRSARVHRHEALPQAARRAPEEDRAQGRGHLVHGHARGHPVVIAAMEYGFIGGSMGVVVGEKITRASSAR